VEVETQVNEVGLVSEDVGNKGLDEDNSNVNYVQLSKGIEHVNLFHFPPNTQTR